MVELAYNSCYAKENKAKYEGRKERFYDQCR